MKFLTTLFGAGKSRNKAKSKAETIKRLEEVEELLMNLQKPLDEKIELVLCNAKIQCTINKRIALQALRRKKRFEMQLQQVEKALSTIELRRESLEKSRTSAAILKIMGYSENALKATHQDMDVNKVNDLMEEDELQALVKEILEDFWSSSDIADDNDEYELTRELKELEHTDFDKGRLDKATKSMPIKSMSTKTKQQIEEDMTMRLLAEWAS